MVLYGINKLFRRFICIVRELHHLPIKYMIDLRTDDKIYKFLNDDNADVNDDNDDNNYTKERYKITIFIGRFIGRLGYI